MIRTFTSTGTKLIHHPDVVKKLQVDRIASPISLQVAPTSRCNLKCVFCSNANRSKHEDKLKCDHCGYDLRAHSGDGRCPECGVDFLTVPVDKKCPHCGEMGPETFELCWNCGRATASDAES